MGMELDGISRFCFGACYSVALAAEWARWLWPGRVPRITAGLFVGAGILAHTLYLLAQRPTFAEPYGSLLLLAWVLAVFELCGSLHYRRRAWGIFILPLVIFLVVLTGQTQSGRADRIEWFDLWSGERFWGAIHGIVLLLGAVGVSVGCIASIMYLVQSRRLLGKSSPAGDVPLLSLERLETMNRRAVFAAFPLLTVGLLVGAALLILKSGPAAPWTAWKTLGTIALWLAFGVLLALRWTRFGRGRLLAIGTIAAFGLLVMTLAASHSPLSEGGGP